MKGLTSACRLTEPLATTANKSPCPLVRKGTEGDTGGKGDRIWFYEPGFGVEPRVLDSLTEYRGNGTPGDWMRLSNAGSFFINKYVLACRSHVIIEGASFWYFLRKKVQLALGAKPRWVWIVSKSPVKKNICYTNHLIQNTRTTHNKRKDK
jgi:hypothetical protein